MIVKSNWRLANVKTRRETGLDYVIQNINLITPFGKKQLKDLKAFPPGMEAELNEEFDRVEKMITYIKENQKKATQLSEVFMEMKDTTLTVERSRTDILSVVELYEMKSLLLQMRQVLKFTATEDFNIPKAFVLEDTESLLDELDPSGDRLNTFYIYDEFSAKLHELRVKKHDFEILIRKSQKKRREEIRKEYGIQLTPKFDIVVAKSHADYDKILNISDLELVDQDYMSATFQLKLNDEAYAYMGKIEELNGEIEVEEELIRKDLSEKIAQYSDVLLENCTKIGALDLALAKAYFFIERNLTRPEIVAEHVIEFIDGRNLAVEEVVKKKGKEYCPVSLSLRDGVTVITGANMGGKTISLKLAGQVAILAQYGFFVPAVKAKVGLSNYMQMLIGDSQSVERGLSSFGSEMEELKEILDKGEDRSLILVDEIASGTNPTEGTALTKSLVDYLIERPYISLITTHFETVTEREGVVNMQVRGLADCDFVLLGRELQYANRKDRINIISKYMDYRLCKVENEKQVPKDALNIATMLGIDKVIIDGAKKYIK
ncbi:MAG: DNA mismatch repair protein MutS [Clostridia bacterium]|nr:DNA mismatch repair protein MutS [Clostridia bacterium]